MDQNTLAYRPCTLIPVYNHWRALQPIVSHFCQMGIPVLLIDDGSDNQCKTVMEELAGSLNAVHLHSLQTNSGKGAAIKRGLAVASELGFSHALQIDADGQHSLSDAQALLSIARDNPDSLVLGYPAYDDSVPRHRYYARYLTHIWIWINTLSTKIIDSMCGYRVYPVTASCKLVRTSRMGDRMDFDSEFVVRWYWQGLSIEQRQTHVTYPQDGISHFRLWRDNVLISLMHAKLFLGMLCRLPKLARLGIRHKKCRS